MTICDICEDRIKKTQRVNFKIDMPIAKDNFEFTFDLCKDCIKYVSAHTFLFTFKQQIGNINDNMDNRGQ